MMTPVPLPRASVPPPPPPSLSTRGPELARELPQYGIDGPASEATRVDREMEARARAMNLLEAPSSVSLPAAPFVTVPAPAQTFGSYGPSGHVPGHDSPGREVMPSLRASMLVRVRFFHGDLPLWSLVTPILILIALGTAFAVAAVSTAPPPTTPELDGTGVAEATPTQASTPATAPSLASAPSSRPASAPEPLASGALPSLSALPSTLSSTEILEIASKHASRELGRVKALAASLDRDPALAQDEKTQAEIRRLLDNQETSRQVLAIIAGLPGPISADLLYEVWTGTVLRNENTDLARALLLSEDVRPKASPALAVSLDLRQAERCEDTAKIIPRAKAHGDRRALHLLVKLTRKYGCGANKREDCYPCLRGSDALDQALKAVKNRREPKTFGRR